MTKNIFILFVCILVGISFFSCNKSSALPEPSIVSFNPASGQVGTTVVITGIN